MRDSDGKELKKNLVRELKKIRDDRDFILGAISIARYDSVMKGLLYFIQLSYEEDESISSDDVLALAFVLRNETDGYKGNDSPRRKIAAAML